MSLDFVILGESGKPTEQLSLSIDLHHLLMETANRLHLKNFTRFYDYYEDAEVHQEEIEEFIQEIHIINRSITESNQLFNFLNALNLLAINAQKQNKSLLALAD